MGGEGLSSQCVFLSIQAIAVNSCDFSLVKVNQGTFWCVNCFVTSLDLSMATMFSRRCLRSKADFITIFSKFFTLMASLNFTNFKFHF